MKNTSTLLLAAAALTASFAASVPAAAQGGPAANLLRGILLPRPAPVDPGLAVFGTTADGRLIRFGTNTPATFAYVGFIAGFTGGDTALVGIDFRIQNGLLYGVGNAGGIYTVDTVNASLTFVNRTSVPLTGTAYGVDFNPAADRLRIISNTGQNLRHNVNAGGITLVDGALSYAAPAVAAGVVGAAYTNNDLVGSTGTTLFDIDSTLDQVVLQVPPNSGGLAATGLLGRDVSAVTGFDIFSARDTNGVTVSNTAYASVVNPNGTASFLGVNVLTGLVTEIGTFPEGVVVTDISVAILP